MVRHAKWELLALIDGGVQPEHTIDGRTCVEALPGKEFSIKVKYHGGEMHQVELFLDGKSVAGRKCIDGTGSTTFPCTELEIKGWKKAKDGQTVESAFVYEQTSAGDGGEDAGSGLGSAPADWTRGIITLRVFGGIKHMLQQDANSADHNPDTRRACSLSERDMIKGGHSASAGSSSSKTFGSAYTWRAGQSYVARAPGDPLQAEVQLFYRDSFFLLLKGDASKVVDSSNGAEEDTGYSKGVAKARAAARSIRDTTEALSKRQKGDVIDLTDD